MKRVKRGQEVNKKIFEPSIFFFIFSNPEFFLSGKCQVIGRWHTIGLPLPEAASEKYFFFAFYFIQLFYRKKIFFGNVFFFAEILTSSKRRGVNDGGPVATQKCIGGFKFSKSTPNIHISQTHTLFISLSLSLSFASNSPSLSHYFLNLWNSLIFTYLVL